MIIKKIFKNFFNNKDIILLSNIKNKYLKFNYNIIKVNSINFNFSESREEKTKTRYIKVIKGENQENKIVYKDFENYENEQIQKNKIEENNIKDSSLSSSDNKIQEDSINNKNKKSKLKFFGAPKLEIDKEKPKINKSLKAEKENLNIFNKIKEDEIAKEEKKRKFEESKLPEEITENLINYNQFFSDYCRVYVKAGDGGNGSISVLKGPLFDQVSPQGGDGGNGGDVIFKGDETVSSLARLRKAHFFGNEGETGYIKAQDGKNAKNVTIDVPVGTLIYEMVRNEGYLYKKKDLRKDQIFNRKLVADLDYHGKEHVMCKGGKGGIGNFTNRTLRKGDKLLEGLKGEEREFELVLKCLADVGFIGFPNAGKSTLLAALTRAVPKIASYPFTTLHPHMGKLRYKNDQTLNLADLPGLIEGAHLNKGLGHKFLKHVERTKILLFLIDGSIDPNIDKKRNPIKDYFTLKNELEQYDLDIMKKPFLIAFNKFDINEEIFEINYESFIRETGLYPTKISGKTGYGLENLTEKIIEKVDLLVKILEKNK